MRKSTLAAAMVLLISVPGFSQAKFSKQSKASATECTKLQMPSRNAKSLRAKADAASIMLPTQEVEFEYVEGEWIEMGLYTYAYDKRGNTTSNAYSDGISVSTTNYTYNENNMVTDMVETYTQDGETENTARRMMSYDQIVTDVITNSVSFQWIEDSWQLVADGHTYRRDIARNDKGQITSIEIHSYFMGEYMLQFRTSISYNADGLPETWKYEELGYNGEEYFMEEKYTLTDMVWYTTDGQILVLNDLSEFTDPGNNRLRSANVTSQGETTGKIEASYEESGNYSFKYIYTTEPIAEETYTITFTDEKGSYTETCVAYEDIDGNGIINEVDTEDAYTEILTVVKDKYGRITDESMTIMDELAFAAKYNYTYDEAFGSYPTEQVFTEYNFETTDYVPFLKIVANNFIDVTAQDAIQEITAEKPAENAIYDLQGRRVINPTSGLYISNGKKFLIK